MIIESKMINIFFKVYLSDNSTLECKAPIKIEASKEESKDHKIHQFLSSKLFRHYDDLFHCIEKETNKNLIINKLTIQYLEFE